MRVGKDNPLTIVETESEGRLYRSPMPRGRYDIANRVYPAWKDAGIDVVISLTSVEEFVEKSGTNQIELMEKLGFEVSQQLLKLYCIDLVREHQLLQNI